MLYDVLIFNILYTPCNYQNTLKNKNLIDRNK